MIISVVVTLLSFFIVMAVSAVANIVRSSLGPLGLDKMLVDDVGVRFLFVNLKKTSLT